MIRRNDKVNVLSTVDYNRVRNFIMENARALDVRVFAYLFENGSQKEAAEELAKFQNEDGGFGHGIEPDIRMPDSSPIATTVGLQYARKLKLTGGHRIVRKALEYLNSEYDESITGWHLLGKEVNDHPHAPWWSYDHEKGHCGVHGTWANPNAEITGYLHEYEGYVPNELIEKVTQKAREELGTLPEEMEMHDFLCYKRLMESVQSPFKEEIEEKLKKAVRKITKLNPGDWEGYGMKPLQAADSPASPFFPLLKDEVKENLHYEMEKLREAGYASPNWSWFGKYEEEWVHAEKDWQGHLTVELLKTLKEFGCLDD
ncbi:hypothetical protein D3H55_10455 [Bacillus salacetis]|uniref:Uncharacterized protein n=1 Tax=Bacillus salacetis TaxID=2315464 RepID=A0A3A1QYZ2_9BACI|nr:hypothetical protein D3H55_10455 [Bacillus salacetis]